MLANSMLPCKRHEAASTDGEHSNATTTTSHFQKSFTSVAGTARHLLAEESSAGYCSKKRRSKENKMVSQVKFKGGQGVGNFVKRSLAFLGKWLWRYPLENKVPLLSTEALHHLHIFIFVLAIVHVTFCLLTVIFGGARIRQWKHWEDSITKQKLDSEEVLKKKVTHVGQHTFIREHFLGIGKDSVILGWMHCFFKQFHASVTKSDYVTLRLGFIMTHCRGNPKFNFHKYMIRALEDDFKRVVGIRQLVSLDICGHILAFEC
ncbi:hypothetical protein Patl1_23600 [Pistacia atlantica]|uniref:Uncharacterized protein n=1 Tax=Pistacia atlantica TaxID=434234 RepID=A0ACC0ZYQ9_9ROSI|nr:hypothetical protein Patl1_23600 [Pistacia atlantica]